MMRSIAEFSLKSTLTGPQRNAEVVLAQRFAFSLLALSALAACGGKTEGVASNEAPLRSMAQCPDLINEGGIAKVCAADDQGNFYPLLFNAPTPAVPFGLTVVPSGRKVAVVYVFKDGYVPDPHDVAADAARTYAAAIALPLPDFSGSPVAVSGPCCPEQDAANRVASHAVLNGNTMTVSLDDVPGDGLQVAQVLAYPTLYASSSVVTHFSVRFYVGRRP
jgi:hypothetical protein